MGGRVELQAFGPSTFTSFGSDSLGFGTPEAELMSE